MNILKDLLMFVLKKQLLEKKGRKLTVISTIEEGSITFPARSSRTLVTRRKETTPRLFPRIQSAIACGMFSCVIRNEKSTALVMM